ncbi:hypothetical protein AXG93_2374s1040 [Marchantia polymorpha subsp. ruderalis]|uniref:Uncharacterized protein n=1 Tax=Marchantia polymorpha subsp. ruderalis TaxID=1480154 RepID=A0A176WH44_MARPO|nr:hypothetical protein AXG93_2374s1040 [Marchantia polymorpha subsp. ruderalis]
MGGSGDSMAKASLVQRLSVRASASSEDGDNSNNLTRSIESDSEARKLESALSPSPESESEAAVKVGSTTEGSLLFSRKVRERFRRVDVRGTKATVSLHPSPPRDLPDRGQVRSWSGSNIDRPGPAVDAEDFGNPGIERPV